MPFEDVLRNIALTLVRFSVFAGNGIVFGSLPVALWVLRPALATTGDDVRRRVGARVEAFVRAGLVATAFGTAVALLIQATLVSQVTGSNLGTTDVESVLATPFGRWQALRLPVAAALWMLVCPRLGMWALLPGDRSSGRRAVWWSAWGVLGTGLLLTSTMSGHAVVSSPRPVAIASDLVHLAAGATWFAGVLVLAVVLPDAWRKGSRGDRLRILAAGVARFSRVAMLSIGVVGLTGVVNSFLNVAAPNDLLDSSYGRTLVLKLGFFGVILALGGINHYFVRRRLEEAAASAPESNPDRLFRKTIAVELAMAMAVLLITGLLVGLARTRESVALAPVRQREAVIRSKMPPSEPNAAARTSAAKTASTLAGTGETALSGAASTLGSTGSVVIRGGWSPGP